MDGLFFLRVLEFSMWVLFLFCYLVVFVLFAALTRLEVKRRHWARPHGATEFLGEGVHDVQGPRDELLGYVVGQPDDEVEDGAPMVGSEVTQVAIPKIFHPNTALSPLTPME